MSALSALHGAHTSVPGPPSVIPLPPQAPLPWATRPCSGSKATPAAWQALPRTDRLTSSGPRATCGSVVIAAGLLPAPGEPGHAGAQLLDTPTPGTVTLCRGGQCPSAECPHGPYPAWPHPGLSDTVREMTGQVHQSSVLHIKGQAGFPATPALGQLCPVSLTPHTCRLADAPGQHRTTKSTAVCPFSEPRGRCLALPPCLCRRWGRTEVPRCPGLGPQHGGHAV